MESRSRADLEGAGVAGGELLLRLSQQSDAAVVYGAELSAREGAFRGQAHVEVADGKIIFTWAAGAAPDWLVEATRAVLRTLWRARSRVPLGEAEPWPRRIKRWRPAPSSVPPVPQEPDRGAQ